MSLGEHSEEKEANVRHGSQELTLRILTAPPLVSLGVSPSDVLWFETKSLDRDVAYRRLQGRGLCRATNHSVETELLVETPQLRHH